MNRKPLQQPAKNRQFRQPNFNPHPVNLLILKILFQTKELQQPATNRQYQQPLPKPMKWQLPAINRQFYATLKTMSQTSNWQLQPPATCQKNTDNQPLTSQPPCNNRQETGKTRNEKLTQYDYVTTKHQPIDIRTPSP